MHKSLYNLMLRTGCKYVSVDIPMPIESEDQIVDLFVQKMESEGDIDFAIIGTFFLSPIKFTQGIHQRASSICPTTV